MKTMRVYPLRVLLPGLLLLMFLLLIVFHSVVEYRDMVREKTDAALFEMRQEVSHLQWELSEEWSSRTISSMEEQLAFFATDPRLDYALVAAPTGKVLLATRQAWKGSHVADLLPENDLARVSRAVRENRILLDQSTDTGLVEVIAPLIAREGEASSGEEASGWLLAKFNLKDIRQQSLSHTMTEALRLALGSLLGILMLLGLLRYTLTRPLRWLAARAGQASQGDYSPLYVEGSGSLSRLASALNCMSHAHRQSLVEQERQAMEERTLRILSRLCLEPQGMQDFLQDSLESLLKNVPWLALLPQGAIFLTEDNGRGKRLNLTAKYNFAPELHMLCSQVEFGHCLCGRAAASREIQFAGCVDDRHDNVFQGMHPHGHYNVPILYGERVLGVIVLYLPENHVRNRQEESFLLRAAEVLSLGISRRYAEAEAAYLAYHDSLTGLANRNLLLDRLEYSIVAAARHERKGALLFMDLDNFKTLNDVLGHSEGDQLLSQVAARLRECTRGEDTVARLGGDEFVILLPDLGKDADSCAVRAWKVAEKMRRALSDAYQLAHGEHILSASIGITLFPDHGVSASEILKHADTAMYQAKKDGRNTIRHFEAAMQAAAAERLSMEKDLRQALENNQFELYYQPQYDARGRIVGAEALLRWHHPEQGFVNPDRFIPVAEATGMIVPIGEWVLREACESMKFWMDSRIAPNFRHIAVNVSPREFSQPDYVDRVDSLIRETGIAPGRIRLEITEGLVIDNLMEVIGKMTEINALGMSFSMDDFGTGYSSLSYLRQLPLHQLKIDKSFVQDSDSSEEGKAIVAMIIDMAHHLSLDVVAEGVETREQLAFLRSQQCMIYQGYYFSRPLKKEAFTSLLKQKYGPGARTDHLYIVPT